MYDPKTLKILQKIPRTEAFELVASILLDNLQKQDSNLYTHHQIYLQLWAMDDPEYLPMVSTTDLVQLIGWYLLNYQRTYKCLKGDIYLLRGILQDDATLYAVAVLQEMKRQADALGPTHEALYVFYRSLKQQWLQSKW